MLKQRIQSLLVVTCLLLTLTPLFSQTIPRLTPELEDTLLAVLRSGASFQEKAGACRQLGAAGSDKSIPVLIGLLSDDTLSHMARYGLETLPGPAVEAALRHALKDLTDKPLVGVIGSLGVRRDTQAVEALIELVHHTNTDVSQAALRALGSIGNAEAAEALQTALAQTPVAKQLGLYEGLFRCAETQAAQGNTKTALAIYASLQKREVPFQIRSAALRSIIVADPVSLPKYLESDDYLIFGAAVQASLELPGQKITRTLIQAIAQQPPEFQVLLVSMLGHRADESALPTLHKLARPGDTQVRLAAMKSLSQIGHASTAPRLVTLCEDPDPAIAQTAKDRLAAFPSHADPAVLDMFASTQTSQRLIALELIGLRRMKDSLPALMKGTYDTEPKVRIQSVKIIGQLGSAGELPPLLALLQRVDNIDDRDLDAMRQALTELCARVDDPDACVTQLINALSQSDVKQKVLLFRVLSSIEGPAALKVVRAAVDDPNADIHLGAIRALSTWHNADAAPELLALVKTATNTRDRTLCLRGFLQIAEQRDLPTNHRLAMCKEIEPLLTQTAEKQQWLGVLGRIDSPKALAQIRPCFGDPAVKDTACTVSITLIERLVKKTARLKQNPSVVKTLQDLLDVSQNADFRKRAKRLLGPS